MPRTARVVLEGFPHHVIVRGNNRRRLFSYPRDYEAFQRALRRASAQYACDIHALVLMGNHAHFIVTPRRAEHLARFMQCATQRYAAYRNRTYGGSGKLFEGRYRSMPIASLARLAATTAYIELNPVRAGLVAHPTQYLWSTCRIHCGDERRSRVALDLWRPSSWYESLSADASERVVLYRAWLDAYHARWRADVAQRVEHTVVASEPVRMRRQPTTTWLASQRTPGGKRRRVRIRRPDGSSAA